jgi:undecaprenol kinase
MRNKNTGNFIEKYVKSFLNACSGIKYIVKYERNVIIMLLASVIVCFLGFYYNINIYEWLFVILSIGLVIGSELINSAIEATIDLITLDKNPLAKIAKDTAAGATLVFSVVSFVGALIIFCPKIV